MFNEYLTQRISAKAVIESEGGILILHPSNIDTNRKWHIPGGIRDEISEALLDTAIREVHEETKIDLKGISNNVVKAAEWQAVDKGEQVKILAVFYHFKLPIRPEVVLSDEHDDFAWLNKGNHDNYETNQEVHEIVESLL